MKIEKQNAPGRGMKIAAAAILALTTFAGGTALADDDEDRMTISGNSTFSDCDELALYLTGDLVGCLSIFPRKFECEDLNGFDRYTERGREHFVGTLHGEWGEFKTRYVVQGVYGAQFCEQLAAVLADDDPTNDADPFALQLAGGCDHKVRGKSGVFEDVDGLIIFYDVIPGIMAGGAGIPDQGASNFLYGGYLREDD